MALNKTLSFDLELKPGGIPPIIHASQGDIGRMFKANIYWDGSAATSYISGATVNLRGKKPDKTVFDYTATLAGSTVTFETTEQMTIISGPVECELVFSNDGDVITSANFVLIVEESPYNPDALSESDVTGLSELIDEQVSETIAGDIVEALDPLETEVTDIRTGYDEKVYTSAGNAVRGQIGDVYDYLDDFFTVTKEPNLFNFSDVIEGGYYNIYGDIVENSSFNYSPTYSEVEPDTVYYPRYYNGSAWATARVAVAWYNENKTFISQSYNSNQATVDRFTSPANAKYVRISYHISLGNSTLVFADFPATSEQAYGYKYALKSDVVIPNDVLYGKVLCCVGDSITYGADMDADGITDTSNIKVYNCNNNGVFTETTSGFRKTFGWQIASRHNMTFYNGGVSGSTMQGITNNNGFSLANGRYTKLPNHIDYLLIWFGWNDTAYGTLGTISDTTNASYYGGYNVVMPYLINKYPYAKIALVVPFGTDENHRNAVRQLGDKWGVAVWDNYKGGTPLYYGKEESVNVDASIVTSNRAKFQANGAHPNYKGHTQLANMIEEFLKGI